jgi:hypothetical protein
MAMAETKVSYFDNVKVIVEDEVQSVDFYYNIWFIIYKNKDKHIIIDPYSNFFEIKIEGIITKIYSFSNDYIVICTDLNTYFMKNHNSPPKALNFICDVSKGDLMLRNSCVLNTIDNRKIFMYLDGNISENDTGMIADHIVSADKDPKYLLYTNWQHHSLKISSNMFPEKIFKVGNRHLLIIDNVYYCYNNYELNMIEQTFDAKQIFVDGSTKTLYNCQNVYIIDMDDNVWSIGFNTGDFRKKFHLQFDDSSLNSFDIREIFYYKSHYYVIGTCFILIYESKSDNPLYKYYLPNNNSDQFELITDIWGVVIKICNTNKYILIRSEDLSEKDTTNENIIYDPLLIGKNNTYIVSSNLPLFFGAAFFYTRTNDFIIRSDAINPTGSILNQGVPNGLGSKFGFKYLKMKFNNYPILVDKNMFNFDIIYSTLIATNFSQNLKIKYTSYTRSIAHGEGLERFALNSLVENIKIHLLCKDTDCLNGYKFDFDNPFWKKLNNCYYFGKMLLYLVDVMDNLDINFSLNTLIKIYTNLNNHPFNIDELAPFHKILNSSEFISIKNMDKIYKTDNTKFKELSLPYNNFDDMIYDLLKINVDKYDVRYIELVKGMYDYNSTVINLNMYELSKLLGGDILYNREKVLNNIYYRKNYNELDVYLDVMKKIINDLTNEELKQFMINVTGHIIRENRVSVYIYSKNQMKTDILIQTCADSIYIKCTVFQQENHMDILKTYLCKKDLDIDDSKM